MAITTDEINQPTSDLWHMIAEWCQDGAIKSTHLALKNNKNLKISLKSPTNILDHTSLWVEHGLLPSSYFRLLTSRSTPSPGKGNLAVGMCLLPAKQRSAPQRLPPQWLNLWCDNWGSPQAHEIFHDFIELMILSTNLAFDMPLQW